MIKQLTCLVAVYDIAHGFIRSGACTALNVRLPSKMHTFPKIYIAYSGGLDSHVLLHILAQAKKYLSELRLTAVHVNHNLSPNAVRWSRHCQKVCRRLHIPLLSKTVNARIKIPDHSPEEIARKLRYEVFAKILPKNACLLTAHHADDQAETLLLQLFRGAGPKGLAAMPRIIPFAKGWLVRPLLQFRRAELESYAREHKLEWIEDESNVAIKYDRNLIRTQLLPQITERWPGVTTTLNRVASHCAEASDLLTELAAADLQNVQGGVANTLAIKKLHSLSVVRQRNVIRYWLKQLQLTIPSDAKLSEVIRTIINSRSDATPLVAWHGTEMRRYQDNLYAMLPLAPHDNKLVIPWNTKQALKLPNELGVLSADNLPTALRNKTTITIRFRQGGEKIKLSGRKGTHELKKIFQEMKIPPWLRDRVPLIYCGEKLIYIGTSQICFL